MLNVNTATKNSYLQDSGDKQLTITFTGLGLTFTNEDLAQEDFELTERVNADETIEFVGCLASSVKFTLKGLNPNSNANFKGRFLMISIKCNNTESIPLFRGYVDEVEQQPHSKDKVITAYDILYKLQDTNVAVWYTGLTFPITLKNFRDSLFTYLDTLFEGSLEQVSTTLVNDSISIVRQYDPTELKAIDVIKSMCQINCVFGRINRYGRFEYMTPPNPTTVKQEVTYYKEATYQEYNVDPVDKLTLRFSDGTDDVVYGGGANNYIIVDNFFTKGLSTSDLSTIAQRLYNLVSGFYYQPFEANINGLPFMECLDVVSLPVTDIDTGVTSQQPYVILERTLKGIQAIRDELQATGEETQRVFESDLSVQVEELKRQVEILREDIDNAKFAYYLITNDADIIVANGNTVDLIPTVYFTAKKESVVMFSCEILLNVATRVSGKKYYDAKAKLTYYVNGIEVYSYYPTENWQDGKHILTLYHHMTISDSGRKRFKVRINVTGGSVTIKSANLRGSIYGQNLVASNEWNGLITIEETPTVFAIPGYTYQDATESVEMGE